MMTRFDLNKLADFVYNEGARSMVEVGTAKGISTNYFADAGLKVVCVDPYAAGYDDNDGQSSSKACEDNYKYFTANALKRDAVSHLSKNNKGLNSEEASSTFDDGSLDFVYIDACHKYECVLQDINLWRPKVKKNMFLGGHDWDGAHGQAVRKAVKESLGEPDQIFNGGHWLFKIN